VEFVQQLYNAQKRADPGRPAFVNFQGWKPNQYRAYIDAADIVGFDLYPIGGGSPAANIGKWADRARTEVAGRRPIFAIVEGYEGEHVQSMGRQLTPEEVLVQGYIAICHGVHGLFYFFSAAPNYIDPSEAPGPWKGIAQMCREILSAQEGLHRYLVPPSRVVEYPEEHKLLAAGEKSIHYILREAADGAQALITVNDSPGERKGVYLRYDGLPDTEIRVLFEDRTLRSKAGKIYDDFPGYGRHVYLIPAAAARKPAGQKSN
jgi:hypothetical protein